MVQAMFRVLRWSVWGFLAAVLLAACGGGDGDSGAPVIALQPAALSIDDGSGARFEVSASGDATISYQWRRNGENIEGATGTTLAFDASYGDNGALFDAVVRNAAGSATSSQARLTVRPVPVTIAQQPAAAAAQTGATQSFGIVLSGGTQPVAYQWRRNGVDIAGATGASYTTPVLTLADDGASYTVVVTNPAGSVTSAAALLSVGSAFGQLNLSGPGAASVGAGASYVPVQGAIAMATPPVCGTTSCDASLALRWSRGAGDQLYVQLLSQNRPTPGATPGTDINGISLTLSPGSGFGLSVVCLDGSCDFAALGIVYDAAARTLSFNNTVVAATAPGAGNVTLSGVLRY